MFSLNFMVERFRTNCVTQTETVWFTNYLFIMSFCLYKLNFQFIICLGRWKKQTTNEHPPPTNIQTNQQRAHTYNRLKQRAWKWHVDNWMIWKGKVKDRLKPHQLWNLIMFCFSSGSFEILVIHPVPLCSFYCLFPEHSH